jgi:hypothetical protein
MWRSFFLAIGLYLIIAGTECLAVDRVYWRAQSDTAHSLAPAKAGDKEYPPEPWVPWSLLSSGAVVCLYSFTIPKRLGK